MEKEEGDRKEIGRRQFALGVLGVAGGLALTAGCERKKDDQLRELVFEGDSNPLKTVHHFLQVQSNQRLKGIFEAKKEEFAPEKNVLGISDLNIYLTAFPWMDEGDAQEITAGLQKLREINTDFIKVYGDLVFRYPKIDKRIFDLSSRLKVDVSSRARGYTGQGFFLACFNLPYNYADSVSADVPMEFWVTAGLRPVSGETKQYGLRMKPLAFPCFSQPTDVFDSLNILMELAKEK